MSCHQSSVLLLPNKQRVYKTISSYIFVCFIIPFVHYSELYMHCFYSDQIEFIIDSFHCNTYSIQKSKISNNFIIIVNKQHVYKYPSIIHFEFHIRDCLMYLLYRSLHAFYPSTLVEK